MADIEIKGLTSDQMEELEDSILVNLGPIPTDDKGVPLYTKNEFALNAIFNFIKGMIAQARGTLEQKSKPTHSANVESEYGKISKA